MDRTTRYVLCVVGASVAIGVASALTLPTAAPGSYAGLAILALLALTAEMLAFAMSPATSGSIAFIPYLAAVITLPSGLTLLVLTGVKIVAELNRPSRIKAGFNVAQHVTTCGTAALVYHFAGGVGLEAAASMDLLQATKAFGLPALLGFASSFAVNELTVAGVLAVSTGKPFRATWRETFVLTMSLDLLAIPLVFVFAWIQVRFGPLAAATLWVPILGLRQVHKINHELERTTQELLELMVKSIEARDPYTSGHSRRVQRFAIAIARAVGLSEQVVQEVGRAALLHDVGKIHEKYAPILRKPDKLTPEEWQTMQEHPEDGASLVSTVSGLRALVPAIRHHHERWDGTGYPAGLAGERIPLGARVIMVADTIDAMTSARAYRGAMEDDHVRAELLRCRGTQFDPAIIDQLLSSPHWRTLLSRHADVGAQDQVLSFRRRDRRVVGAG